MNRCRQCGAPADQAYCQACSIWFAPQQATPPSPQVPPASPHAPVGLSFVDPYATLPNQDRQHPSVSPPPPGQAPPTQPRGRVAMVIGAVVVVGAAVAGIGLLLGGDGVPTVATPAPRPSTSAPQAPSATARPTTVVTVTRTAVASAAPDPVEVEEFLGQEPSFERYTALSSGDGGYAVTTLQGLLTAHGVDTYVDGEFGPATERSVLAWQTSQGLYPSGIVDDTTWASLTPKLRAGAEGAAVEALQRLLDDQGYTTTVDGRFGEQTTASVRSFQSDYGLTVDGIVGQETWPVLLA